MKVVADVVRSSSSIAFDLRKVVTALQPPLAAIRSGLATEQHDSKRGDGGSGPAS